MASHIVLTDGFHWSQPGWNPLLREHRFAKRGETIDLPDEVLQTFSAEQLAALGTEEDLAELDAAPAGWLAKTDDEISNMTVEQLVVYLDSAPEDLHESETERVVELEQVGKARKSVLAMLVPGEDDDEDDGLPPAH